MLLLCSGNVQKLSNPTFNPDITLDAVEEPIKNGDNRIAIIDRGKDKKQSLKEDFGTYV